MAAGGGLSGLTDDFILKANGTTAAEISAIKDDGGGVIEFGTVTGNRHEQLFATPTGTHQHTWPAVTGNVAQTTGTLTERQSDAVRCQRASYRCAFIYGNGARPN